MMKTVGESLDKLMVVFIWRRVEGWLKGSQVVYWLQATCNSGLSCFHSAMLLKKLHGQSIRDLQRIHDCIVETLYNKGLKPA